MVSWVIAGVAFGAAAGCTRERVIVVERPMTVQEKSTAVAPTDTTAKPAGTQPSLQVATPPDKSGGDWGLVGAPANGEDYERVVQKVAGMVGDGSAVSGAQRRGLSVLNVMWEDTGRAQGSSIGPNISDLTLQVRYRNGGGDFETALMPVIRFPNFTDRTGDVPADRFFVRVGNEKANGTSIESVLLVDVLKNIRAFASVPRSILGSGNLLAPRDTHFLVSAQAVFLPIPKAGKAEFNPVLFNYQSAPRSPAVLSILVTREGTSISVIENRGEDRGARSWGQELYFNNHGQRASFTAERRSDVEARIEAQGGPKTESDKTALQKGADVLFLVQVPLVHEERPRWNQPVPVAPMAAGGSLGGGAPKAAMAEKAESDVEQAVLGHGPNLGPFNEGRDLKLVRDTRFPIRVTVQFYKATSNGVVSEADLDGISRSIGSVYEHADFVGSLVVPEGDPKRPTAWQKIPREWFPW
jgi:hypothetical protein